MVCMHLANVSSQPKTDLRLVLMALETIGKARPANDPSDTERIEFDQVVADIYGQLSGTDAQNDTQGRDLPIGLVNLRNTCYLNSILQYFFSVNAVRDLALRCASQPPLPSTQDDVRQVLQSLSMTGLQPGRAFLANHCKQTRYSLCSTSCPRVAAAPSMMLRS